jgi:gas vesicle protein
MGHRDNSNGVANLLTGIAVGGVLGILFAPEKGDKLRDQIKLLIDDELSMISRESQKVRDKVGDFKNKITDRATTINENVANRRRNARRSK